MSSSPSADDWKKLSEASLWLHESTSWDELAERSPLILHRVIGADLCCWNEVDGAINLPRAEMTTEYEETAAGLMEVLLEKLPNHPLLPDKKAVTKWPEVSQISDVLSQRNFEDSGLYRDAFRHLDTRYQLMGQPYLSDKFTVLFSINRKHCDFNDRDRQLLSQLLGHYRIACKRLEQDEALNARLKLFEEVADAHSGILTFTRDGVLKKINSVADRLIRSHFPEGRDRFLVECRNCCISATNGLNSTTITLFSEPRNTPIEMTFFPSLHRDEVTCVVRQSPAVSGIDTSRFSSLSSRQREVLGWMAEGKTNAEIARILGLSPRTVEKHCENIFEKLGVENRFAASLLFSES